MLDVFVIAILIVAMKSAAVAEIHIGLGLNPFIFSVVANQLASAVVARQLDESQALAPSPMTQVRWSENLRKSGFRE